MTKAELDNALKQAVEKSSKTLCSLVYILLKMSGGNMRS